MNFIRFYTLLGVLSAGLGFSALSAKEDFVIEETESNELQALEHHAHEHSHKHEHALAPIGVMGSHIHEKGEWMFSYRYMTMSMEQNYDGTDVVGSQSFISAPGAGQRYVIAPTSMQTQMHVFGGMVGVTDQLTLSIMVPYLIKDMSHIRFDGVTFDTHSEGIGDLKLGGMYKLFDQNHQTLHVNFGLSVPTGSIAKSDSTPNAPPPLGNTVTTERRLPYPMQLGSGSVDLLPGITYLGQNGKLSWGSQVSGVLRTHENSEDYTLGHEFHGTGWLAYEWLEWLSSSMRIRGKIWGDISGRDSAVLVPTPMMNTRPASLVVPTADPERRSGERIDLSWGLRLLVPGGFLEGHSIAMEAGLPVYQNLDGPQLGGEWFATAGWQWAF
ncbi:MAG: transporter [Verrucomicrobiota bacterium]